MMAENQQSQNPKIEKSPPNQNFAGERWQQRDMQAATVMLCEAQKSGVKSSLYINMCSSKVLMYDEAT